MKRYLMTPAQIMALSFRNSQMMAEASMIISMRMLGMAGMWRVNPAENARMVEEKITAMTEGSLAASRAMLRGAKVSTVADAAMKPARKTTAANVKRLAKLGPGKPT